MGFGIPSLQSVDYNHQQPYGHTGAGRDNMDIHPRQHLRPPPPYHHPHATIFGQTTNYANQTGKK
jgi:hypothetical protein